MNGKFLKYLLSLDWENWGFFSLFIPLNLYFPEIFFLFRSLFLNLLEWLTMSILLIWFYDFFCCCPNPIIDLLIWWSKLWSVCVCVHEVFLLILSIIITLSIVFISFKSFNHQKPNVFFLEKNKKNINQLSINIRVVFISMDDYCHLMIVVTLLLIF